MSDRNLCENVAADKKMTSETIINLEQTKENIQIKSNKQKSVRIL